MGTGHMGSRMLGCLGRARCHLMDIDADALARAVDRVSIQIDEATERGGAKPAEKTTALARVATTANLADLGASDLIVEAATEIEAVKHRIFADLTPRRSDASPGAKHPM